MPIVGTFEADFSQFNAAVTGATRNLRTMEAQSQEVSAAFASMDADRHFVQLNETMTASTNIFGRLATSLGSVDRILAQFGLNLTPVVAALRELSVIAGAAATGLGLMGTAAAVAATAFFAWKVGTWIKDLTGLDKAAEAVAKSMLGVNEAAIIAAHQADVIARASAVAGREVTTFAEATKILADESDRLGRDVNTDRYFAALRDGAVKAQQDFRNLTAAEREQITVALERGAKAADIERVMGLQAGTIDVLIERNKLLAEQERIQIQLAADRATAIQKVIDKQQKFIELAPLKPKDVTIDFQPTGAFRQILDEATAAREQAEALAEVERQMRENLLIVGEYANANKAGGEAAKAATDTAVQGYAAVAQQVALSGDAIRAWIDLQRYSAQVNAILAENTLFTSRSQRERIANLRPQSPNGQVVVNIDASNSFLNTAADTQRLAETVGSSINAQLRGNGRQVV